MRFAIKSRLPSQNGQRLTPHALPDPLIPDLGLITPHLGVPVTLLGTVGAVHGEPFALSFQNDTGGPIEVRFTIDGIDIMTGKPADLGLAGDRMWAPAYGTIELEAWPESMSSGGRFVFAPEGMAVADHLPTGSPKGIICAAVFIESAPPKPPVHNVLRGMSPSESWGPQGSMDSAPMRAESFGSRDGMKGGGPTRGGESPMRGVGVGVGEHVAQPLTTVEGLRGPRLHSIFMIKVAAWDDLQARLLAASTPPPFTPDLGAFGFPGQKTFHGPDLSGIPRMPAVREPQRLG